MTHISTRSPGTLCFDNGGVLGYARVEAVVVSEGVFIADVIATSDDNEQFDESEEQFDMMRPIEDFIWFQSALTGMPAE